MKKYYISMRNLVWIICLVSLVWSCDQTSGPVAKPKVVRKKIIAQKDTPAPRNEAKKATSDLAQPLPTIPKDQKTVHLPEEPQATPEPIIVAKKEETAAPPVVQSKPALSPKSEIAAPKPPPEAPQPKPIQTMSQAETKTIPDEVVAPKMTATQGPTYDPKGKIDPFEPLFADKQLVAQVPKKDRKKRIPRTPLEKIDLSQLKLVAIVLAKSGNRAMVEETTGKGYIISPGTYIGTNSGKVVQITKEKVIVAEEIEDVMGNITVRNTEMQLPKPAGEL